MRHTGTGNPPVFDTRYPAWHGVQTNENAQSTGSSKHPNNRSSIGTAGTDAMFMFYVLEVCARRARARAYMKIARAPARMHFGVKFVKRRK